MVVDMASDLNIPSGLPERVLDRYKELIMRMQTNGRGALISGMGHVAWLEDYDEWQARIGDFPLRLQEKLKGGTITIPSGLTHEERREYIREQLELIDECKGEL